MNLMSDATPQTAKKMKYYRSRSASALTVILGPPAEGEVTPEKVRFSPFEERYDGDPVRVGYLKSDDSRVHKRLKDDSSVEEIEKDEYEECTDLESSKVKPLPL